MAIIKSIIKKIVIFYYSTLLKTLYLISPSTAARKAAWIFRIPRGPKLGPKSRMYLSKNKFERIKIESDCEIQTYHWPNKGPKLLLAHGWESSSARWQPYIQKLLNAGIEVFALDAPAHGFSGGKLFSAPLYAKAIYEVAEKYEIDILLGHSAGAYSCIYAVHEYQLNQVNRKFILLAPTGKLSEFMEKFYDILSLSKPFRKKVNYQFEIDFDKKIEDFDTYKMAPSLEAEGILIHDTQDRVLPYEHSVEICDLWEKGKLITTQGFGHRLRSSEVTKIVIATLKQWYPDLQKP